MRKGELQALARRCVVFLVLGLLQFRFNFRWFVWTKGSFELSFSILLNIKILSKKLLCCWGLPGTQRQTSFVLRAGIESPGLFAAGCRAFQLQLPDFLHIVAALKP
jgi:hypothetical protein